MGTPGAGDTIYFYTVEISRLSSFHRRTVVPNWGSYITGRVIDCVLLVSLYTDWGVCCSVEIG